MTAVVVIGAGVVGMSCAWHLARRGADVTVVDPLGPGEGCSFGNIGGVAVTEVAPGSLPGLWSKAPGWLLDPKGPLAVRWAHLPRLAPWLVRFLLAGRRSRVEEIARDLGRLLVHAHEDFAGLLAQVGRSELLGDRDCIAVYDTAAEMAADAYAYDLRARNGFPCRTVSAGELVELEPAIAPDLAGGRVYEGWHNVSDPHAVVLAIAEDYTRQGGTVRRGEAAGFVRDGARVTAVVLANGERIAADHVVVAAGAWSHRLARLLGDRVPLESERGYHTMLPEPGVEVTRSLIYAPQGFGLTPMSAGLRVGGSVELAGLDAAPDYARADVLVEKARRLLPGLDTTRGPRWAGHRPATPDSMPVIGLAGDVANVAYAFGHGHLGLTLGPLTGRLVAELIVAGKPSIDLTAFSATRF